MRAALHRMLVMAICLAISVSSLAAPEAFALSTVTLQTGPTTFSPNGDGQDDIYVARFHLSQPGNVTARVFDVTGGTVAVLAQNQSFSAGSQTLSWDGRAEGDLIVSDGSYTLSIESTDADQSPTSASVAVVVDTRTPGRLVAPVPGSSLSGLVDFVFEPAAGMQVSYVYFALSGCSWYAWDRDAEGLFAVRQADTGACQPGDQTVTAQAYWVDQFGAGHHYNTVPVAVTVVDSVAPTLAVYGGSGNQVLALSEPDRLSSAWFAATCTDGSLVSWSWVVKDASGAMVRTGPTSSPQSCYSYYAHSSMTWDGLDDAGVQVLDGSYVVTATATDQVGLSSSLDFTAVVDTRTPGSLIAPEAGSSLSKLVDFEFEPTAGMQVSHVYFGLPGCGWYAGDRDAEGLFAVRQADTTPCQSGDQPVTAQVYWVDQFGAGHYFQTASIEVTVIDTAAPTVTPYSSDRQVLTPSEPGVMSSTLFTARCSDGALVTWSWTVKDAAGTVVRTGMTSSPEHCRNGNYYYPHFYDSSMTWDGLDDAGVQVPDGSYVVTATATDEGGLSSSVDFTALVDSRTPGDLVTPVAGASVSELADFVFEPAPGMQVSYVYFELPGCGWYAWGPDAEGLFAVRQAHTGLCLPGDQTVTARVYWLDQLGAGHYFTPAPVSVAVADSAPTITAYSADKQVLALTEPGRLGTGWFAAWCSDTSPVSWAWTVQDASGSMVRTWPTSSPTLCHNYRYYTDSEMTWDGLDDAGMQVPDGSYVLTATATDEGGLSRSLDFTALVDTRTPGSLVEPAAGSQLSGRASFAFQPAAEFEGINQISLWMSGISAGMYNPSPDGVWRTTYPMGSVPAGPTTLNWAAYWIDEFGGSHWFGGSPIDVAVDPTAISLDASIDPVAGKAPFSTTLTLTASDPNDRPVTVKVDWGDGTMAQSQVISLPYDPVALDHTFADPGTYNVVVTATNGSAGFASTTIPVSVAGAPNQAPTLALSATETGGFAPFNSSINLRATDPDGDALTMRVDFGDGSAALTGPLTSDPITHVYGEPGTYLVRAQVSDGRASTAAFTRITVVLSEPLRASAGDDLRGAVGSPLLFDGSASAPAVAITKYSWDFGDGTSASGSRVQHSYTNPGTYKAQLTVTSGAETSTDEAVVVVEAPPAAQGLTVTVTSDGVPVAGATVLVIMPDGSRIQQTSDGLGAAFLPGLANGDYTVYVAASGYEPATAIASVNDRVGTVELALSRGELAAATLDARPLTYEEIVDAGISVADPDNYHVYEATINLHFERETQSSPPPVTLPVYVVDDRVVCRSDCSVGGAGGDAGFTIPSPSGTTRQYLPKVIYVADQPIIQWLVIPTTASFLKQFFEVQMIVQNLTTDFTFEQGSATLTLPSGLSLAPTTDPQSPDQVLAPIPGGASATAAWVVRGDAEGLYDLTASYSASVEPLGVPVRIQAATQAPLHVWGASALKMTIYVEDVAMRWSPYEIEVVVENVTDEIAVHNVQVELIDPAAEAVPTGTPYIVAPDLRLVQGTAEIPKGGAFHALYTVFPGIGSEQTEDLIFELSSAFIRRSGGDVDLHPEVVARAPRDDRFSYPINMKVMQTPTGEDFAHLEYKRPDTNVEVDHYLLYTRHTLNEPGNWTLHSEKSPFRSLDQLDQPGTIQTDSATIMASERAIGRYYGLATVYADGTVAYQHRIGEGPARYVALGDSYSSGEGVPDFEPGTAKDLSGAPDDNECHRSQAGSYSRLLAEDPALEGVMTPVEYGACSGAVTKDVFENSDRNPTEKPQRDRVNQFTDLITLSMGGNDIGFADIAMACVGFDCHQKIALGRSIGSDEFLDTAANIWDVASPILGATNACANPTDLPSTLMCVYKAKKAIDTLTEDPDRKSIPRNLYNGKLHDRLVKVYVDLANRAPHAQIAVVEYPQISANDESPGSCHLFDFDSGVLSLSRPEREEMHHMTVELNDAIQEAVDEANTKIGGGTRVFTVNLDNNWDQPLCKAGVSNPDSYMNTVVNPILPSAGNHGPVMYSFHPNALGHQVMRDAIVSQIGLLSGVVQQDETLTIGSTAVPDRAGTIRTQVAWPGSTVGLGLVAPSGRTFGPGDAGVRSGSTPTTAWLEVDSPESGLWKVQVTGIDVDPDGEQVQVTTSTIMRVLDSPVASVSIQSDETDMQAFTLDASASTVSQGAATFSWLFSDGTTATGPRVEHVFTNTGQRWASLRLNDGISSPTLHSVELGIAPEEPIWLDVGLTPATAGTPWSHQFEAGGYPEPQFLLASGTLPEGLILDPSGLLSGTPQTAGSFTFTVTASNSAGEVTSEPITLLVLPTPFVDTTPPVITGEFPAANPEGWHQAPVTVTWTATDPEPSAGGVTSPQPTTVSTEGKDQSVTSPEVCDAAGNCATGSVQVSIDLTAPQITGAVVADPATGVHVARFTCTDALSGVAACPADQPLQPGTATYTGEAVDLAGNRATTEVSVSPPVIDPVDLTKAVLGASYNHQFVATGYPAPAFSLASGQLPAGLTLDASGLISGTPTESGSFSIAVRADNDLGSDTSDELELTVTGPPTFTQAAPPDAWQGTPYSYQFKADGFPAPTFAVASGELPDGLELSADGLLSGTATDVGTFTFGVSASNSVGMITTEGIVVVVSPAPINDTVAPVVSGVVPSPNSDGWYNTPVLVTWHVVDVEPSSGGVLLPDPTNVATEGRDQLVTSPEVCDAAGNCATGSVTVSIDLTSPTITAWVVGAPAGSPEGAKVVTFTCADELSGLASCPDDVAIVGGMADPITGTVTDRAGNIATTTITVSAPSFTSTAPPLDVVAGEPYSFTFTATGLPLPSFAVASGSLPPGLTLASTGELTGTPMVPGAFTFSVAATSLSGRAESGPYSVRVLEPAPTVLEIHAQSLPGAVVGQPYSAELTARGGTAPYAWSSQGRTPSGIDIAADGSLSGVPTKAGTYSFKVTVKDAARDRATLQVQIKVTEPDIALTPAKLPNGKVGRAYESKIVASGGTAPYTFTLDGATSVNGLTLSPTGVLSGSPVERGTFEFTVRVTDSSGAVGWRQHTWKVN